MSKYPGAAWKGPIPNQSVRGMSPDIQGVVLHIMEGTLVGTDSWFHNPVAKASAHFGVGRSGTVYQWVDTSDKAWAQADGNPHWISIELEGKFGDKMTGAQIVAVADIVRWSNTPLKLANTPAERGIGYHAMGGAAWGGHPCPGDPIKDQRQLIINVAVATKPAETVVPQFNPPITLRPIVAELDCPSGGFWLLGDDGSVYAFSGAPYSGGANGQPYFAGRKAARLTPGTDGHKYTIVATSGETYDY